MKESESEIKLPAGLTDEQILNYCQVKGSRDEQIAKLQAIFKNDKLFAPGSEIDFLAQSIAKETEKKDRPSPATMKKAKSYVSSLLRSKYNALLTQKR